MCSIGHCLVGYMPLWKARVHDQLTPIQIAYTMHPLHQLCQVILFEYRYSWLYNLYFITVHCEYLFAYAFLHVWYSLMKPYVCMMDYALHAGMMPLYRRKGWKCLHPHVKQCLCVWCLAMYIFEGPEQPANLNSDWIHHAMNVFWECEYW